MELPEHDGSGATGNVVCTNANMAAVTSGTFTLVVKVTAGTANGTMIGETVSVGSSALDPNSANNTASVSTLVGATGPNLSVTNVGIAGSGAGGDRHYLYAGGDEYGNHGSYRRHVQRDGDGGREFDIRFGDSSGGMDLHGISGGCVHEPERGRRGFGNIHSHLPGKSGNAEATPIVDTATVTGTNQSYGANSAVANDVVAGAAQADLVLSAAGAPGTVIAGNSITYTRR